MRISRRTKPSPIGVNENNKPQASNFTSKHAKTRKKRQKRERKQQATPYHRPCLPRRPRKPEGSTTRPGHCGRELRPLWGQEGPQIATSVDLVIAARCRRRGADWPRHCPGLPFHAWSGAARLARVSRSPSEKGPQPTETRVDLTTHRHTKYSDGTRSRSTQGEAAANSHRRGSQDLDLSVLEKPATHPPKVTPRVAFCSSNMVSFSVISPLFQSIPI